jgi:hypothetical protein
MKNRKNLIDEFIAKPPASVRRPQFEPLRP